LSGRYRQALSTDLSTGLSTEIVDDDCVAIFCKTFWDFRVTKRSKNLATSYCLRRPGRPAFDRSRPDKGSEPGSTMARRPVAMPCGWPTTVANATTFGHPPGARASGDYSTRSHSHRSMSRSGGRQLKPVPMLEIAVGRTALIDTHAGRGPRGCCRDGPDDGIDPADNFKIREFRSAGIGSAWH
jgi:hypothetical protein